MSQFFELFHMASDYFATSLDFNEQIDSELEDCLAGLLDAYLESVRSMSKMTDLLSEWVLKTHETLIPFKAKEDTNSVHRRDSAQLLLPQIDEDGEKSILVSRNKRLLELFLKITESFI